MHTGTRTVIGLLMPVLLVTAACLRQENEGAESSAGGGLPDSVRSSGEIVIGSELTTPPLTYRATDGTTIKGLNYDLAQALSEELGVEVRFEQIAFDGLITAVRSGKVDMALDVINDTKERQEVVDFIDYLQNGTTMLVRQGNPDDVDVLADLCGKTVALIRGSVQLPLVEAQSQKCADDGRHAIEINQFARPPDARLQVQTGQAAAFMGNTPVMIYLADHAEGGKAFDAATTEQYLPQPVGMIFAKSNTALRDTVLDALKELWADGTYHRLMAKYDLQDLELPEPVVNGADQ